MFRFKGCFSVKIYSQGVYPSIVVGSLTSDASDGAPELEALLDVLDVFDVSEEG